MILSSLRIDIGIKENGQTDEELLGLADLAGDFLEDLMIEAFEQLQNDPRFHGLDFDGGVDEVEFDF